MLSICVQKDQTVKLMDIQVIFDLGPQKQYIKTGNCTSGYRFYFLRPIEIKNLYTLEILIYLFKNSH